MAAEKLSKFYSFLSGFVQDRNTIRFIAQLDELNEAGATDSTLIKWVRKENKRFHFELDWYVTHLWAFASPEILVFALGPDGRILRSTTQVTNEERIGPKDNGPDEQGLLRDLRYIGKHLYAAGMGRQVYRRKGADNWVRCDKGVLQSPNTKKVVGFNAINGASEGHVYAVGYSGEIWQYRTGKWKQMDSPTNVILNDVIAVDNKKTFVCGNAGTLLRGDSKGWTIIAKADTDKNLYSMAYFKDKLYVASDDILYQLTNNDTLKPVNIGLGAMTCGHLHVSDGVLLSVGRKNVCWTEDTKKWFDLAN